MHLVATLQFRKKWMFDDWLSWKLLKMKYFEEPIGFTAFQSSMCLSTRLKDTTNMNRLEQILFYPKTILIATHLVISINSLRLRVMIFAGDVTTDIIKWELLLISSPC